MRRIDPVKIGKIALGCCAAYAFAHALGLRYATSVVTITLLSIQDSKRDTLLVAGKRSAAFAIALVIGGTVFTLLHFSLLSLGVFLLLFALACQALRLVEGLSMSTVLMLHFWSTGDMSVAAVANESILMAIGIVMGILLNLYMPGQVAAIRADQRRIEERMRQALYAMAEAVTHAPLAAAPDTGLTELETLLKESHRRAHLHVRNTFNRDMDYYVRYMELRQAQYAVLRRMEAHLSRLTMVPAPAPMVAHLLTVTAWSLHEYNNAGDLLAELRAIRGRFREAELPATRSEFENRAVLFEIVNELQELMLLKKHFAESLTPTQIRAFWKESPGPGTD